VSDRHPFDGVDGREPTGQSRCRNDRFRDEPSALIDRLVKRRRHALSCPRLRPLDHLVCYMCDLRGYPHVGGRTASGQSAAINALLWLISLCRCGRLTGGSHPEPLSTVSEIPFYCWHSSCWPRGAQWNIEAQSNSDEGHPVRVAQVRRIPCSHSAFGARNRFSSPERGAIVLLAFTPPEVPI
jgi:hypothetical protein